MITIDGSQGEGGGQILRSSLTLSLLTGEALRIKRIRAGRKKPGLAAQHLAAVEAARRISDAQVEGAALGSTSLLFQPGSVRPGRYRFDIGTAGSTSLVLQTIFLPLALCPAPSQVTITGGTHVPWSPCFHYLQHVWLPALQELGFKAELHLVWAGFYPKGGGEVRAAIRPRRVSRTLKMTQRGALRGLWGLSAVANLPMSIAARQRKQVERRLKDRVPELRLEVESLPARGKGTVVFLKALGDGVMAGFTGLGARGKPAERVADEAVDALDAFLATDAAIDPHLADQLLLPLAITAGVSCFSTSQITRHLLTHADVVRAFLPAEIEIEGELGEPGWV
ncbi:MAG: RNA 3'-terminal phosphate cyclase, partial [Chloroflexi bacterium]|nr:RNA 3'-terminal phosphate cyclase [Chloroflexota bacterium]